jgi:hypothetical protein
VTWVHEQIYAAGGDHIPTTWVSFADQTGVTAVLHLAQDRPSQFRGELPKSFLWMDIDEEKRADLNARHLAGNFLLHCVKDHQRILLHSSSGRHRTRWAYVAYCICAGMSVRKAIRLASNRPWLSPYYTDIGLWETFAGMLKVLPTE